MKLKFSAICVIALALLGIAVSAVLAGSDIDEFRSCSICGMDRKAYGYSRMLVQYKDGTAVGVCSLHCAVTEIDANKGRHVASMMVADRDTRLMIDAEKAFWVMGGKKRGVMTKTAKWAFATKEAAQLFVDSNGGQIADWSAALHAATMEVAEQAAEKKGVEHEILRELK